MLKMRTGENIYKRKDGRWEARYHKGRNLSGRLIYGFCYGKTYSEAKMKMEQAKADTAWNSQSSTTGVKRTFGYYCDLWLQMNKPRLHSSSFIKYQTILERHIKPYFGSLMPNEFSDQIINTFSQTLLQAQKYAAKTVKDILLVLHAVLKYTQRQFSNQMPAISIVYPKETPKRTRVLNLQEEKTLTDYLMNDPDLSKFGVLLSLWTGMRIGELCALQCGNINLEDNLIYIDATMQRLKNNEPENGAKTSIIIGPPKSLASVRTIPLSSKITEVCRCLLPEKADEFVLTGTTHFIEPRTLQRRFQKYASDCMLKDIHFHTLRHTFATRCVESGMDMKTLSEILGHSNATVTMNRYVHCSLDMKRRSMEKVNFFDY